MHGIGRSMLAHSIYGVAYRFYQEHIGHKTRQSPFVDMLVNKYLSAQPKKLSLREKIRFFIKKNLPDTGHLQHHLQSAKQVKMNQETARPPHAPVRIHR